MSQACYGMSYRYSARTRRQALLLLIAGGLAVATLVAILVTRWATLSLLGRGLGLLLLLALLPVLRAQWLRLTVTYRVLPDRLEIVAPLGGRAIRWEQIVEVRRIRFQRPGQPPRWACTLLMRGRRGNPLPYYAFDDQVQGAATLLAAIVAATPQAVHQVNE
ncbi:PH domain-containing protein [Kallotenue papyrolyticum]|uniref:PH domain-containing protein n=1 Tax=Kallotenue papyrolyticum TaxID=1325125 RepID=UPI001268DD9A|nr:PH domain-containing protein [Kallotenue papyrolyticum]